MQNEIICFHNPDEVNGYLSNWYLSDFIWNGISFTSMEQYMMYRKAIVFHDTDTANRIRQTDDVGEIKVLGRSVRDYNDTVWNGLRQIIMYEGLIEKFKQNDEINGRLLSTQDAVLAECAVHDKIWGIGLSMTDPRRTDLSKWQGQNLLGFALMEVRNALSKI